MLNHEQRWREAQSYERQYWEHRNEQILSGETADLGWYAWRADRLMNWLEQLDIDPVDPTARILEIGNGPVGMISYLQGGIRIGVDPLECFFDQKDHIRSARDPAVQYLAGQGERLPVRDGSCDLVIVDNCLDHVIDPITVLQEVRRVTRTDGLTYISVNVRSRPGYLLHRVLSILRIDLGHPHTFTDPSLRALVRNSGFKILDCQDTSYLVALRKKIERTPLQGIAKGIAGITEMPTEAIATPR